MGNLQENLPVLAALKEPYLEFVSKIWTEKSFR
jgi:hypothetical protein